MKRDELEEIREGFWGRAGSAQESMIRKLFEHINSQAKQIATLKAALTRERDRYLVDFIHEHDRIMNCEQEAREELAREMPGIFQEDR